MKVTVHLTGRYLRLLSTLLLNKILIHFLILNAQREAHGLNPLPSLAAETVDGMTPKGKALLNHFRSQARSQRGYAREIGEFRPEMVKYGDFIQQSAATHGVEPAEIAALLEIESAGDPDAVSPTGAQGLMQIQTDVHHKL